MTTSTRKPGQFQPGQSGNPAGRKPGKGAASVLRAELAAHLPEILGVVLARAMAGDMVAARLLVERCIAPLKAQEALIRFELPAGNLTDQGRAVVAAIAAGHVSPAQGAQLIAALGTLAKIREVDELTARIEKLEVTHDKN